MNLSLLIVIPFVSALVVLFTKTSRQVRLVSSLCALLQLVLSFVLLYSYWSARSKGDGSMMLFESQHEWYAPLNINYHVGVDGISVAMILLTSFVVMAGILVSWQVEKMSKEFFFLLLLLSVGAYGFFISLDLFTLFFFLELAVIPKFLLIGVWGSGKKEYSAMKLALMLMAGSAFVFIGLVGLYFNTPLVNGHHTFDLMQIARMHIPVETQKKFFPFAFVGFGIFGALFPFHTWVPDGHSSAPTAASMFLAGISMKLGGYGCLRVATFLMPDAAHSYSWIIIILSSIAILYGAFATMMQTDLKYINAYSSVSHCGFVLFGIGMLTKTAITGAVMQMVSHGLMTALFFAAIGMIYDRTHTRQLGQLGGLLKIMPFISTVFVIAGLCSLGLPGLSGFVAEMTVFMGSWQHAEQFYRIATIVACASIVVTAVYILGAVGKVIMGPLIQIGTGDMLRNPHWPDARWSDKCAVALLIIGILAIGVAPFWLDQLISPASQNVINKLTVLTK